MSRFAILDLRVAIGKEPTVAAAPQSAAIICSGEDRKSTRLNSSHMSISYAVFCLKKKKVIRLLPTGKALIIVNLPGDGKNAQATAMTPDGKQLIVADYSRGISLVDLATFKTTVLQRQDGKPLRGIAGVTR